MIAFGHLLQSPEIKLLGWSLIHFLWQGAIVAALLAAALPLMRRHTANARYLVACAALLLMAACPVVTWTILSSQSSGPMPAADSVVVARSAGLPTGAADPEAGAAMA